jgi:outer membrane receptor protein involved in Fe transport
MKVLLLAGIVLFAYAAPAFAQGNPQSPSQPTDEDKPPTFEEQVVVSASRSEQTLVNAPAAVTLINATTIQNSPASNIGELLRPVPGLNVTQVSARDINITTRGATSTLATSQLALVDGRSIYLDFFGMVMWDLVPANVNDIRQIEVIRGPASAVWGANAMSGVVNVITRTPRELAAAGGTTLTIGAGAFNRNVTGRDQDSGSLFYVNGSHAQGVDGRWTCAPPARCSGRRAAARSHVSRRVSCRYRPAARRHRRAPSGGSERSVLGGRVQAGSLTCGAAASAFSRANSVSICCLPLTYCFGHSMGV